MLPVSFRDRVDFARRSPQGRQQIDVSERWTLVRKPDGPTVRRPNGTAITGVTRKLKRFRTADNRYIYARPAFHSVFGESESDLITVRGKSRISLATRHTRQRHNFQTGSAERIRSHEEKVTACRNQQQECGNGRPYHCNGNASVFGWRNCCVMLFASLCDGRDEAVAQFRHRLDEMGNLSGIPENFAQTIDDGIETGVEIHKGVGRPYGA